MQILRRIFAKIERHSNPGINWIKTLYFNFRILPFNQAKKLPVLIYGKPRFNSLSGKIIFNCEIAKGLVKINQAKPFSPCLQTINSQLNICGTLIINGITNIGCGTKIVINQGGVLELGRNSRITDFCNIGCYYKITIGDGSIITHRCQVMDTNYHFVLNIKKYSVSDNVRAVVIGKECWIANTTTIAPGTVIPDNSIIGSNSLVNKDFSTSGSYSLIAGIPAKVVAVGFTRIFNADTEDMLIHHFANHDKMNYKFNVETDIKSIVGGVNIESKHINNR